MSADPRSAAPASGAGTVRPSGLRGRIRGLLRTLPALVVGGHDEIDRRLSFGGVHAGEMTAPTPEARLSSVLLACRAADEQTVASLARGGLRPAARTGFRRLSTSAFLTALKAYRLRKHLPRLLRAVRPR